MAEPMTVKVVASDAKVWEGQATSVIVRTTEGDLGILRNHEAVMAVLVPHAAEILTPDGQRKIIAIASGFVSVFQNHVSIITAFGELADDISVDEARTEVAKLEQAVRLGHASEKQVREYDHYVSQLRAAEKMERLRGTSNV